MGLFDDWSNIEKAGFGGIGALSDFFGGGDNPADAAMPYFNKIPGMEKGYFDPYINRGNSAYDKFSPQYDQMTGDPAGFLQGLLDKYTPSKDFQMRNQNALKAAGNTAAAGGMRGSINDINNEAGITDSLLGADMQQWLNNVLGIQGRGLSGEQGLYNTGYDASKSLAGDIANVYGTEGSLAFQGQAEENKRRQDMISGLEKMGASIAGMGGFF